MIRDICHKKDGGTDVMTILDLVGMDKEMFLVHQLPTKPVSSYLLKFKGTINVDESSERFPLVTPSCCQQDCLQQRI